MPRWPLNPVTSVFIRNRRGEDIDAQRGKGHMKTEARLEGRSHKPRNVWSHQKLEKAGRTLPGASGGMWLCPTWISDFWLQTCERVNFACSEPQHVSCYGSRRSPRSGAGPQVVGRGTELH